MDLVICSGLAAVDQLHLETANHIQPATIRQAVKQWKFASEDGLHLETGSHYEVWSQEAAGAELWLIVDMRLASIEELLWFGTVLPGYLVWGGATKV